MATFPLGCWLAPLLQQQPNCTWHSADINQENWMRQQYEKCFLTNVPHSLLRCYWSAHPGHHGLLVGLVLVCSRVTCYASTCISRGSGSREDLHVLLWLAWISVLLSPSCSLSCSMQRNPLAINLLPRMQHILTSDVGSMSGPCTKHMVPECQWAFWN